jgi:hypothetical protein
VVNQDQISDILDEHIESKPFDGRLHIIEVVLRTEKILEIRFQESHECGGESVATKRVAKDVHRQSQQETPQKCHFLRDGRRQQEDEVDIKIWGDEAQELYIVQKQYLEQ